MPEPHQGYTNYETFSVGVVLMNDRVHYDKWLRIARERLAYAERQRTKDPAADDPRERAIGAVAEHLIAWGERVAEPALDAAPSPFSSAFRAGYNEIDWDDIAREWVDLAIELGP